ncbi:hypothetical protein [Flexivirga oryzae]|uniref:Beta-phosphoglucomutase-like phosphatase (HAD superfamily) n=1 Tax=Flexivirga oryzae TaxID=1794944 RepID=A0A839N1V1_9MICO|nr:hypothetical protein [Flexivirga oryzae]MBB2891678.1 beta-phosphoglucomutase-like phosphatase (HAD superfamily) [Flexivirga oryzae]
MTSGSGRMPQRKKFILFDHDGVLVDTEHWYYRAGERALADIGLTLDRAQYLRDIRARSARLATFDRALAATHPEPCVLVAS